MEKSYQKGQFSTRIFYGETLNKSIDPITSDNLHVIILTNQKYYDRSFEKISQLFKRARDIDWYICRNQTYCNNLEELMNLLHFLERFPQNRNYLFCGYGNEGVMQLTGFLAQTTILPSNYWCLPVSVRSLAKVLILEQAIMKQNSQVLLQVKNLPRAVYFDQTLTEAQTEGKLVDLLVFIRIGLVCDYDFLQDLHQNFPNQQLVYRRSFAAFIADLIDYYAESFEIEEFGQLFEAAFYQIENGHLLSSNMKRLFGILFHLFWCDANHELHFNFKNFLIWFQQLGYPIHLPTQISLVDYQLQVLDKAQKEAPIVTLERIGKVGRKTKITVKSLQQAIEKYQATLKEIRES
ncbi:hypothetical protein EsVE80_10300 [Enterococcus saigonensis]|uniref:3-dehydroquinate synthase domain-containing protein n=1 Tax=Enterococcus saigonensis TaxID=1805431 RepID=A0A679IQQ5_9ENTE|nr:hypothetical protein [Enterococcus saigonensis]BCA85507.1 hypothetical protein EsVE80_10300 [Enterococcus saigonensis]